MRRIVFLLPGHSRRPVGGYKIVYEYANFLTRTLSPSFEVHIVEASDFVDVWGIRDGTLKQRSRRIIKRVENCFDSARGDCWFDLDPRIRVHITTEIPSLGLSGGDVVVATAAQTAEVAALMQSQGARAIYLIQHFEDWSSSAEFVERTWKLGLNLVVIAPWLQEKAREWNLDSVLIPNAIDPTGYPLSPKPLIGRDPVALAMLSDVSFKRADLVCDVFRRLSQAAEPTRLIAFGTCRRPRSLPGSVEYFRDPSRDALTQLYSEARVYFVASDSEGWHLPPAEALLCGTPVASTDIGGVRAPVGDGGLFSPVGDSEMLAANCRRLLLDPALGQRLADRGRSQLLENSPQRAGEAFLNVCVG